MADLTSLVQRTRIEIADMPRYFNQTITTTGDTNVYQLDFAPLRAEGCDIRLDGRHVPDFPDPAVELSGVEMEEATGKLIFDFYPPKDMDLTVAGMHFRYFTDAELTVLVQDAIEMHTHDRTDTYGNPLTPARMNPVEEYPVALLGAVNALYVLLTDSSFDIDIHAPDGVYIPRSQRYRQMYELLESLKARYKDLCANLGIGMYSAQVFSLRRISARTGRYAPVYKPQEIDDRSRPQRAYLPVPSYGAPAVDDGIPTLDLTVIKGDTFSQNIVLSKPVPEEATLKAEIKRYAGSPGVLDTFFLSRISETEIIISLTHVQTNNMPVRAQWDLEMTVPYDNGLGDEFTSEFARDSELVTTLVRGSINTSRDGILDGSPPVNGSLLSTAGTLWANS